MATRREFLKTVAAVLLTGGGVSLFFEGCAGGLQGYRTRLQGDRLIVPLTQIEPLNKPNGLLLLYAVGVNGPIVLRNVDGEIVALSSICTHRGCEVRPMPNSFECPCHGSEYDIDGEVLAGPARLPLKKFQVQETPDSLIIKVV